MNYFIETLTLINKKLTKEEFAERIIEYSAPNGNKYYGRLTNEGTSKFLVDSLAKNNALFDRIIVLATKECMEDIISAVGTTSFEYYKKVMAEYVEKLYNDYPKLKNQVNERYSTYKEYIDYIIKPVVIPNNPDKKDAQNVIGAIESFGNDTNIYLDFTGGSRVASFIAILLIRILQACNANIKNILYANIQKESEIIDLTDNYNMLTTIENIAIAKSNQNTTDILTQLKTVIPSISNKDLNNAEKIRETIQHESTNLKKDSEKDKTEKTRILEQASKNANKIVGSVLSSGVETAKKHMANSPFDKLKKMKSDDLIMNFYEEMFGVLVDMDFIIGADTTNNKDDVKKNIKDAILANDKYYSSVSKKGYEVGGVVYRTVKWLESTKKFNNNPIKNFYYKTSINANNKDFERIDSLNFVVGVNKEMNDSFLDYLGRNNIEITDNSENLLHEFSRLQRIYFNYGFPFACSNNGKVYDEISNYYFEAVKKLMYELSELKHNDSKKYNEYLDELISERERIEDKIPYMIKMTDIWNFNHLKFNELGISESEFIKVLCKRLGEVRLCRNAIAHKLSNQYSKPEYKKSISAKIIMWIEEYERMIGDGK